jgi:DNA repair photolyase
MKNKLPDLNQALALAKKVHPKFQPVWQNRTPEEMAALAMYFLPHSSAKPVLEPTRPKIVKWYCPFASQCDFPTGHRYCINVYTGCAHKCEYCYAAAYSPSVASTKKDFAKLIYQDMADLEKMNVPPAPVHLSNSTDPFQPLEKLFGHTRFALEQILKHRRRFTTVTILTKNPLLAVELGYIDLFRALSTLPPDHPKHDEFTKNMLPGFVMEVSVAFWRQLVANVYDPCAPPINQRIAGIIELRKAGIDVVLRIDPLFPHWPIAETPLKDIVDFGIPEAQTLNDLELLVICAKNVGIRHVVYSPVKIVQPRQQKLSKTMETLRKVYEVMAAPRKPIWHNGSWRLPHDIAEVNIIRPFLEICHRYSVKAKYCKQNLIETP